MFLPKGLVSVSIHVFRLNCLSPPLSHPRSIHPQRSSLRAGKIPFTATSKRQSYSHSLSPTSLPVLSIPPYRPTLHFIAYLLHRTDLHASVTPTALDLLWRLEERFPTARGLSGYFLLISAFLLASKAICIAPWHVDYTVIPMFVKSFRRASLDTLIQLVNQ